MHLHLQNGEGPIGRRERLRKLATAIKITAGGRLQVERARRTRRMQNMECDLASQFSSTVFTFPGTRASQLTGFQITTLRVNKIEFNFITQLISFSQIENNP